MTAIYIDPTDCSAKTTGHKGPDYYARQRMKRKLPKPTGTEYSTPCPWAGRSWGRYRWSDESHDYVEVQDDLAAAVRATDNVRYVQPKYGWQRQADKVYDPVPISRDVFLALRAHKTPIVHHYDRDDDCLRPWIVQTTVDEHGDHWAQVKEWPNALMDLTLERLGEWEKRDDGCYVATGGGTTFTVRRSERRTSKWEISYPTTYADWQTGELRPTTHRTEEKTLKAAKCEAAVLCLKRQADARNADARTAWQSEWEPADETLEQSAA